MPSAAFCRTRPQFPTDAPPFGQALLTGTFDSSPWIRRSTFTAQALDLPMRTNEDGFVKLGTLADPHRPCIEFLYVASQFWRECGRRRMECRLNERIRRLPSHGRPQLPSPSTLSIGGTVGILPSSRPSFSYKGLSPYKLNAMPGVPMRCTRSGLRETALT